MRGDFYCIKLPQDGHCASLHLAQCEYCSAKEQNAQPVAPSLLPQPALSPVPSPDLEETFLGWVPEGDEVSGP